MTMAGATAARLAAPPGARPRRALPRPLAWRLLRLEERRELLASQAGGGRDASPAELRAAAPPAGVVLRDLPAALTLLGRVLEPRCLSETAAGAGIGRETHPVLRPFLAWASVQLHEWQTGPFAVLAIDWPKLGAQLLEELGKELGAAAQRALLLELNVHRLQGRLSGNTGEERYASFLRWFTERPERVRAFLVRHAGLARLLADRSVSWRRRSADIFRAVHQDRDRLESSLAGKPLGLLVGLRRATPAPVRPGTERVAVFSSGTVLLFKDRPADAVRIAGELLGWLKSRVGHEPFRVAPSLSIAGHTWTLLPPGRAPRGPAAAEQLSYGFGWLVAALQLLGATGLASGDVVIQDDEAILVNLDHVFPPEGLADPDRASPAAAFLARSVLRTGLVGDDATNDGAPPDLSPLGRGANSYAREAEVESHGTDQARMVRRPAVEARRGFGRARPWLAPQALDRGFGDAYETLRRGAPELHAWLSAPLGVPSLHAARRARVYRDCLARATHPDHLGDAVRREEALQDVLAKWDACSPVPRSLLEAEVESLCGGDLPELWRYAADTRLILPGDREIPEYFGDTGIRSALHGLDAMGPDDFAAQRRVLRYSLSAPRDMTAASEPSREEAKPLTGSERHELLAGALEIGRWLDHTAWKAEGRADWWGLHEDDWNRCLARPAGPDFYHGQAGIATFLAYLAHATGEGAFLELARAAMDGARRPLADPRYWTGGGFSGRASVVFGALHVARLGGDAALLAEAVAAGETLADDAAGDALLDVVGGSAGAIAVLLAVRAAAGAEALLEPAARLGRRVGQARVPVETGCFWPTGLGESGRGLTGFAHGSAGIAWALARLQAETGDEALADCIRSGMAHERSLFSEEEGNWLDLRAYRLKAWTPGSPAPTTMAWCHGAPGIGLARATLPEACFGAAEEADVLAAVDAVLRKPVELTDSLCHGELGNLDTLLLAGRRLGRPELLAVARRRGLAALRRARAKAPTAGEGWRCEGWRCGITAEAPTPGLLVGLAGIGYGLLRLWDPEAHPSLLALEPPR
jgi:type 2 lantibiotic biosynthesis protein LanM